MLKRTRTFYKIFISYLIIFILPMIILGTVNYFQTLQIVEDKIKKDNMVSLRQSSYMVDSFLERLYRLSSELSLNQRIFDFLYTRYTSVPHLNLLAREIMMDLREYTVLNDFIGDIFIYSKVNNAIISPTGLYTPDIFYSNIYTNEFDEHEYKKWLSSLEHSNFREFMPLTVKSKYFGNAEKILFQDSLPNFSDNLGCIMVFINRAEFIDAFLDTIKEYNGSFYILDKDFNIIVFEGSTDYDYLFSSKNLGLPAITMKLASGKRVIMTHVSSTYNNWKFVSVIPYEAYSKEIDRLKISTAVIVTACVFTGFWISLAIANKSYKPINNIISFIKSSYGYQADNRDDFEVISNILESSYRELTLNRELLKSHIPMIKQNYLVKILKESHKIMEMDSGSNSFNRLLNINFDFVMSAVMVFGIKKAEENDNADHAEKELFKLALRTTIEEMSDKHNEVLYTTELEDDKIACIYGAYNSNIDNSEIETNVLELITEIKKQVQNRFDFVLHVGIGNVYSGSTKLSQSYEEAEQALSYALLMNQSVVFYKSISKKDDNLFTFPIQKELQLINYIKNWEQEKALGLVQNLYDENFSNKQLTYDMMKFFIYNLYCSLIKAMGEARIEDTKLLFDSLRELNNQNINSKGLSFFLLDIKKLVIYACKAVNYRKKNTSLELKNKIIEYIEKNFLDNQLSLEKIAEEFNVTPQYLSRFFKEHFNVNYVDYINYKRIEKAKEYLLKDEKVKEAALKSGFGSVGTFINVFKKYTGFTPGEYKKMNE